MSSPDDPSSTRYELRTVGVVTQLNGRPLSIAIGKDGAVGPVVGLVADDRSTEPIILSLGNAGQMTGLVLTATETPESELAGTDESPTFVGLSAAQVSSEYVLVMLSSIGIVPTEATRSLADRLAEEPDDLFEVLRWIVKARGAGPS